MDLVDYLMIIMLAAHRNNVIFYQMHTRTSTVIHYVTQGLLLFRIRNILENISSGSAHSFFCRCRILSQQYDRLFSIKLVPVDREGL